MKRPFPLFLTLGLVLLPGSPSDACGPWFPSQYLSQGGMSLLKSPEFFAEIELKLLAREFPSPFKAVHDESPRRQNADRDVEDFETALRNGSLRPPDPDAALAAHTRMRNFINDLTHLSRTELQALPPDLLDEIRQQVFPSEFADYHEGVIAFEHGDHATAHTAWKRLLARPEAERRYRSVQAAFMIGIVACADDQDDAMEWLVMVRDLARKGFHDPAGLAAASYDREADWRQQRGDLRGAAECELRAISAGYPRRFCVAPVDDSAEALAKFASDPLLRRIHTSALLSRYPDFYTNDEERNPRFNAWLAALEAAKVGRFDGADRVAWLCYSKGDYTAAQRWLARAPANSSGALWLEGKLAARAGRKEDSARAISQALRLLTQQKLPEFEVTTTFPTSDTLPNVVFADYAIAALNSAKFHTALEAFLQGDHWIDAAHVAERLLTVEELRRVVSKRPWQTAWDTLSPEQLGGADDEESAPTGERMSWSASVKQPLSSKVRTRQLRWLLARRLARMERFAEARPFYPARYRPVLDAYVRGVEQGRARRLDRETRALAFWTSALEARYHGIELFGTEAAPDWLVNGGNYEHDAPADYRTGLTAPNLEDGEAPKILPAVLRASPAERTRLQRSAAEPDKRFHYRYRAANLAWRAAQLLPDQDPRLAEMLNLAGRWISGRDTEAADRFYQALERRCGKTEIGARAIVQHWFVNVEHYTIPKRPSIQLRAEEPAE